MLLDKYVDDKIFVACVPIHFPSFISNFSMASLKAERNGDFKYFALFQNEKI